VPFTRLLSDNQIRISMDGRGSWRDNVFVERLWRVAKLVEIGVAGISSVMKVSHHAARSMH